MTRTTQLFGNVQTVRHGKKSESESVSTGKIDR